MFTFLRFALQVTLKKYSLDGQENCRRFLTELISVLKPLSELSSTKLDDKMIEQFEYILANDELYEYFYNLIKTQFSTDDVIFESVIEEDVIKGLHDNDSGEPLPESINPAAIIHLITQILLMINSLKSAE